MKKIETSVIHKNGVPTLVVLDYLVQINGEANAKELEGQYSEFRLSYYPHLLDAFTKLVDEAFPKRTKHEIYGDFKSLQKVQDPGFYIHVVQK